LKREGETRQFPFRKDHRCFKSHPVYYKVAPQDFKIIPLLNGRDHLVIKLYGPGVELVEEQFLLSISSTNPVETVHLGAAFPELSDGWKWLDSFKK
jgi:hypothetical protein